MEEQHGEGVRMADIARAADISRQAVYLHFPSRTDLMVAAVHYVDKVNGHEQRLEPFRAATSGVLALDPYVDFWGNYIPVVYTLIKGLRAAYNTDKAAAAAWDDRMLALRRCCRLIIERMEQEDTLAPEWSVDQAAEMFWSLLSVEVWENLTISCGWSTDEYVSYMQRVVRRTFLKGADQS
jgi:AcrR family transcriptional regulator